MSAESSFDFTEFDFSGSMRDLSQGLLVKPVLHNYLFDARFPDFDLHFSKQDMHRDPDNWFHPSTHPLVHERVLYQYLAHPGTFPVEKKQYMGTLAVTLGTISHEFVQVCLTDAGIRPEAMQKCTSCKPRRKKVDGKMVTVRCTEPGFADDDLGERGHLDGLLDFTGYPNVPEDKVKPVFEFKCLAPETLVSMADGTLMAAEKVSAGDLVLGWDEVDERCEPRRVEHVWDNGVVPVWSIETKEGRRIGVTDEHPFLTDRGWVFAKDLRPGDKVRVAFDAEWSEAKGDTVEAHLLGIMVGDGGLTQSGVRVTSADPDTTQWLTGVVEEAGATMRHVSRHDYSITTGRQGRYQNPVRETLRREGMLGHGSHTKFVPRSVWMGGPEVWAAFLSGYFDADGTVVTKGTYPHLLWTSVNRDLLTECQTLLAYLGIRASIQTVNSTYGDRPHQSFRLLVRDRRAVLRARQVLSPVSTKRHLLAEIDLPEREDGRWVRSHQQGWDEVRTVQEGISRPTIAIEVQGGTHVTAGLVTHNTTHDNFGRLSKIEDLDLETFKTRWPVYYAQQQRYMRLSGRAWSIVLMMEMSYPFVMKEFHVPFDFVLNNSIDQKYRRVRQAVADGRPPLCCGMKGCDVAALCGRLG